MRLFSFFSLVAFLLLSAPFTQAEELSCRQLHYIQGRFLKNHISHKKLTTELRDRVLDQLIKALDREKMYFLQSDIDSIKRKNKRLFLDIKKRRCAGLYYIYDIYSMRVQERIHFASQILNDSFLFTRKLKYIRDDDLKALKPHPKTVTEANHNMKSYIQYHVARIFLMEKDLKKSVQQVFYILSNQQKQILSWKPRLSRKELRDCKIRSKNSFKACKPSKWFSSYLNAYSQSLDSHSNYLDKEDWEEFQINMNLELEGIGATLSSRSGYTVVEKLIPSGAAARSQKIKVKDRILAVGQSPEKLVNIFGERIEDVVTIIRGPKGTPVFLKISRTEKSGKNTVSVVELIRDRVELKDEEASISYHKVKNNGETYNVGLVKVPSFYGSDGGWGKSVTRKVKELLILAKKQGIQALVLDLSFNRGGSLEEAVGLSGLFFSKGNVVKQSEKNSSRPQIFRDRDSRVFYAGPLVVLVNRLSASASEIVSGTLQDYRRAVIVGGEHTFGKGSVQSVERLRPGFGALKTTVGLYFIPSGKSTQKEGVRSDVPLPSILNIEELGERKTDNALAAETIESFLSPAKDIFPKGGPGRWKPLDQQVIKKLKDFSEKRVSKNKKFHRIKKRLSEFKKEQEKRKVITIATALKDINEDDDKSWIKEEELENEEGGNDKKKYFARPDIQEALNVAVDLALLSKSAGTPQSSAKNQSF